MNLNRLIIKGKQMGQEIYLIGFAGEPEEGLLQIWSMASAGIRTVFIQYLAIVTAGNLTTGPETEKSLGDWPD
jgi:hypothetical protein